MNKKVAIPTRAHQVDEHFGHCDFFTIYSINNNNAVKEETFKSPEGCGCKSNIAPILAEKGVNVMLAGNMGMGALNVLRAHGIEVIRGCSGNIEDVVNLYLKGNVSDNGIGCHSHEQGCHND